MKAIGLPPSDPRFRQMNDAQWLWCYFNQMEDEKEEAEAWKSRFDYLTYFINYEMAKSVHESQANSSRTSKYTQEGLHKNTEFELEMKASNLGYDPASGLTVEEFFEQLNSEKEEQQEREPDLMNDSFDDLLASGGFTEVSDHEQGVGDAGQHIDDFLEKVFDLEEQFALENQQLYNGEDEPIGIDEDDWKQLTSNQSDVEHQNINQDNDDFDLDIFEVDDE